MHTVHTEIKACTPTDYHTHLPFGVIGENFSLSSCVGETLLLLLLLCGDDNADTALPCESMVRMDELSCVAVARGAPQKFKSNLLPVKRTSRSRRASRSLSKCNWNARRRKRRRRKEIRWVKIEHEQWAYKNESWRNVLWKFSYVIIIN